MSEVNCHNCAGACCKGQPLLTMQLSAPEYEFMLAKGNKFQPVAEPVAYERREVIYPQGIQLNPEKRTFHWLVDPANPYETLPAGFGRYALVGTCTNLITGEDGWEHCGVYDERPQVCKDFEMGSAKCLTMRNAHEIPVPMPTIRPEE